MDLVDSNYQEMKIKEIRFLILLSKINNLLKQ